jgi:hypothetical protein
MAKNLGRWAATSEASVTVRREKLRLGSAPVARRWRSPINHRAINQVPKIASVERSGRHLGGAVKSVLETN